MRDGTLPRARGEPVQIIFVETPGRRDRVCVQPDDGVERRLVPWTPAVAP